MNRPRYTSGSGGPSWMQMFTACFAGTFLAGLLLLVGIRLYIHWSIADTTNQINERMKQNSPSRN